VPVANRFWTIRDSQLLRRVAGLVALTVAAAVFLVFLVKSNDVLGDATNYLAAGERLNAGHRLYGLSPGDRDILLWNGHVFLSPPFIAVIWRPLAVLGPWVIVPWSIVSAVALAWAIWMTWRDHPLVTSALVICLAVPMAWMLGVGNVNGFLMAGTVVAVRRPRWAGVVIGVMAAVKVWPLLLALALIRRRRTALELIATVAICAVVSLLGAGWASHVAYLSVIPDLGYYDSSPAAQTRLWWLPFAILAVCIVPASRGSHRAAIIASTLGNPAFHLGAWVTPILAVLDRRGDDA